MKRYNSKVKAIVAGIGSYNDLGLIRSCGEIGVLSIYLIEGKSLIVPIYKSKYVESYCFMDFSVDEMREKIERLTSDKEIQYIVFPASDSAVLVFDLLVDLLPKNVYVSHAHGNMRNIMDKSMMAKMALESGLDVPKTIVYELNSNNFVEIKLKFPIIIKPVCSIDGEKSDITIILTSSDLQNRLGELKNKGYDKILIQEYIHTSSSHEVGITGVSYPNGEIEIYGYIDKIRNKNKINNYGIYYPNKEFKCINSLKSYIRLTGYEGIFDTDFIVDKDKWYFIECNFRNGAYGYCTTKAGFNMPGRFMKCIVSDMKDIGHSVDLRTVTFMEERTDVLNALDHSITWWKWLRDVCTVDTFLWWNRKDPRPLLRIPYSIRKFF